MSFEDRNSHPQAQDASGSAPGGQPPRPRQMLSEFEAGSEDLRSLASESLQPVQGRELSGKLSKQAADGAAQPQEVNAPSDQRAGI